ncbi:glycine betaine ABC transporter substrate-binding protein [Bacillaceae bacterium S4-13-56]
MFKLTWKHLGMALVLALVLIVSACGSDEENEPANNANNTEENGGNDTSANNNAGNTGDDAAATYGEEMDYVITGIEPGAGVVKAAEQATQDYENLAGWSVQTSSSGTMATLLTEAIENEEPIIVTGWTPHWKFAKYDLHYLEDPQGVFGEAEQINTMVRQGLEEEEPEAYQILDQFNWTAADMESVMLEITNGASEEEAARNWIEANSDKIAEWLDGVDKVDGNEIELVYVLWDSEIASTNVIAEVMRDHGFEVDIKSVENAAMWEAVAQGGADGMVAAWLPGTHGDLYEQFKDELVDLGPNLEGAKIGLVAPDYMEIDSIEDLQPAE